MHPFLSSCPGSTSLNQYCVPLISLRCSISDSALYQHRAAGSVSGNCARFARLAPTGPALASLTLCFRLRSLRSLGTALATLAPRRRARHALPHLPGKPGTPSATSWASPGLWRRAGRAKPAASSAGRRDLVFFTTFSRASCRVVQPWCHRTVAFAAHPLASRDYDVLHQLLPVSLHVQPVRKPAELQGVRVP